jgi:hypothetical protein
MPATLPTLLLDSKQDFHLPANRDLSTTGYLFKGSHSRNIKNKELSKKSYRLLVVFRVKHSSRV